VLEERQPAEVGIPQEAFEHNRAASPQHGVDVGVLTRVQEPHRPAICGGPDQDVAGSSSPVEAG